MIRVEITARHGGVRLPPHGQQPMREVDVIHLQAGHLTDLQRRPRQDHHAVTQA